MSFTYLASPYSHQNPWVREMRYVQVMKMTAWLIEFGDVVYSPIVHHHQLARIHSLPTQWEFWRKQDFGMLAKAKSLSVYCLDGWEVSVGVTAEICEAERLRIPIVYLGNLND